jgi:catechol 2,3-dioxygenase-like lactoylglutathione lyase family enzyme
MNPRPLLAVLAAALFALTSCGSFDAADQPRDPMFPPIRSQLPLGTFSVSLSVKDLARSRAFYEKLGFEALGGDPAGGWQILRNGTTTIGLFQGMFEGNLLTFNPGWSIDGKHPRQFPDVREIQAKLDNDGIPLTTRAEPTGSGPASITLTDPDGNVILIDQHVPAPRLR